MRFIVKHQPISLVVVGGYAGVIFGRAEAGIKIVPHKPAPDGVNIPALLSLNGDGTMLIKTCTSVAVLPDNPLHITHRRHRRGWLETPDGRRVQPNAQDVQFIKGMSTPVINKPRRRWFAHLMGIFA
ncbi:phage filamentation protein Fil family protein [Candidatus Fukatsuia endosymbiont of Tuberolachnus salignus]|uniref:phage filamentation protein Fil family protein n=1 Tax=Candidatus Fukatsuia endosymbiont of Tuberolachnus salignus TaxID=3077957 RepID=UPI00313D66D5